MKKKLKFVAWMWFFAALVFPALTVGGELSIMGLRSAGGEVERELAWRLPAETLPGARPVLHGRHVYATARGPGGYARSPQAVAVAVSARDQSGGVMRELSGVDVRVNRTWWRENAFADDRLSVSPFYAGEEGFFLAVVVNGGPSMGPVHDALSARLTGLASELRERDGRPGSRFLPVAYGAGWSAQGRAGGALGGLEALLDPRQNRGRVDGTGEVGLEESRVLEAMGAALAACDEAEGNPRRGVLWVTDGHELRLSEVPATAEALASLWGAVESRKDVPLMIALVGSRAGSAGGAQRVHVEAVNILAERLARRGIEVDYVDLREGDADWKILDHIAPDHLVRLTTWNTAFLPMDAGEHFVAVRASFDGGRPAESARISVFTADGGGWKWIFVIVGVGFLLIIVTLLGLFLVVFRLRFDSDNEPLPVPTLGGRDITT